MSGVTTFRIVRQRCRPDLPLDAGTHRCSGDQRRTGHALRRAGRSGVGRLAGRCGRRCRTGAVPSAGVTLAPKIRPDDVRIDWTQPARQIDLLVRAANPAPVAWTMLDGQRFQVLKVAPGERSGPSLTRGSWRPIVGIFGQAPAAPILQLVEVKAFGRKPMAGRIGHEDAKVKPQPRHLVRWLKHRGPGGHDASAQLIVPGCQARGAAPDQRRRRLRQSGHRRSDCRGWTPGMPVRDRVGARHPAAGRAATT